MTTNVKWLLLLCGILLILACGCSGQTQIKPTPSAAAVAQATPSPSPSPTPLPTPTPAITMDIKPAIHDLLNNLPKDWGLVTSQDVAQKKPFIVDVRQPDEYSGGSIEGAVNIPLRQLVNSLQALPGLDKDIVVVCSSGHRSAIGMAVLRMLGYKNATSLAGGMRAWQAAKLPVVTQPAPALAAGTPPQVDAKLKEALNSYLNNVLPDGWGIITPAELAVDQEKKSSLELEAQPDHYTQGASLVTDVDEPDEFAKTTLPKATNIPLRTLPDNFDKIPWTHPMLYA